MAAADEQGSREPVRGEATDPRPAPPGPAAMAAPTGAAGGAPGVETARGAPEPEAWAPQARRSILSGRWELGLYLAIMGIALAMRLWDLGDRAIHHDESLHAVYSWYLYTGRGYQHDPMMHGPFQFHMNALIFFLFGDTDATARLGYALFGTALVGMPWLLRGWLGRTGTLASAALLAFSPTFLYFSRFARNDIIMAVWTLGMVAAMWHYLHERRPRHLYLLAALMALGFATKETVYLTLVALGSFLLLLSLGDARGVLAGRVRLSELRPPATLLLLMVSLSLPLGAALLAVAEGPLGMVLANGDPATGPVGLAQGGAVYVAFGFTALLLGVSAALGVAWSWRRWLVCAAVFWGVWSTLYTTFFTSGFGLVSGSWQGLGYWLAQQGVARGGQPWYYYLVIGWNYEFLVLLAGLGGGLWCLRRGDLFSRFLLFWSLATFLLFTAAAEKMPWLLVHLTLPLALLAGKTLGDLLDWLPWRRVFSSGALLGVAALPLLLLLGYRLVIYEPGEVSAPGLLRLAGLAGLTAGLAALAVYLAARTGVRHGLGLLGLGMAALLLVLGLRAGWAAAYQNGDVPTEMLVYTQTSPEVARIALEIGERAQGLGPGREITIVVDGEDGFAWPWVWYLRDYGRVSYPGLATGSFQPPLGPAVVLVNARSEPEVRGVLAEAGFQQVRRYRHRWWFPESYRGVTADALLRGLADRSTWRDALDYWLFRKLDTPLGSVDAYLYYSREMAD